MRLLTTLVGSAVFASTLVSSQLAGLTLVYVDDMDGMLTTSLVQLDQSHARMEAGGTLVLQFNADTGVARVLNLQAKTYAELSKADAERIAQQRSTVVTSVRKIADQQGLQAALESTFARWAPLAYQAIGRDKVEQWPCVRYEGTRRARKVTELCSADPAVVGLRSAELVVVQKMAEYIASFDPVLGYLGQLYGSGGGADFAGWAVRRVGVDKGKEVSLSQLTAVRRESIPASAWEVPAGLRKQPSLAWVVR